MTPDEAELAVIEWEGEPGGVLLPPLTANELAGIVNAAIAMRETESNKAADALEEKDARIAELRGQLKYACEIACVRVERRVMHCGLIWRH